MSGIYSYSREAVRVKVKKCESNAPPEWRKFSVDPQITSLEVLYSILAKAFDLKSDFNISYKTLDPSGNETYLGVLSEWDLDAAFLRAHNYSIQTGSEPCLNLRVDIKPFSEATDWEVSSPAAKEMSPLQQSIGVGQKYVQNMQNKLPVLIMNQMEKTFSLVQRALNLSDDQTPAQPPRPPLSDSEFRNFLDSVGQILHPNELRKVIFAGGIDPSLRRVVWKHILNVYPNGMTGKERMDYMKRKAAEYYRLRDTWRVAVQHGPVIGELAYVTSMVRKDVLRTDRLHPFYAGSDDNQNIASLFNILTTFALNHPSVSYCQGMSDIASPLLVTMGDEAHAYICFCAIMTRLKANFMLDGIAMTQKFTHLSEAIQFYDPVFYDYLKAQQADDLLFCYRWLLLEMKREFAFEDSLRMLEVLWSSLRSDPPTKELNLFEKEFESPSVDIPAPKSPSLARTPRENAYTKVCALRRQSSSLSLLSCSPNQSGFVPINRLDATKRMNHSLDENISRLPRVRSVAKSHQSLDESKMLMLMEHITPFDETADDIAIAQDDIRIEAFHPTNPFIGDGALQTTPESVEPKDSVKESESNSNQNERIHYQIANVNNSRSRSTGTGSGCGSDGSGGVHHNVSPKKDQKLGTNKQMKSGSKLTNKNIFTSSSGNIISKQLNTKKGGHFKELKEKIAAGILASLDKSDSQLESIQTISTTNIILDDQGKTISTKGQKVVKNFNEFLNFTSINKSRISDRLITSSKVTMTNSTKALNDKTDSAKDPTRQQRPLIKLTKNSFDDSDSSTVDTTTTTTSTQSNQPQEVIKPFQLHLSNVMTQAQISLDGSSPDDSQDYYPMTTSMTRELRLELENLDRQVFGDASIADRSKLLGGSTGIGYEKLGKDSLDLVEVQDEEIVTCPNANDLIVLRNSGKLRGTNDPLKRISTCSANTDIFVWENPLHQISGTSSCNFNEIVESTDDENAIGAYTNGNLNREQMINAMTPDEQLDLEYDGDIILECLGDSTRKAVTPLRLIQQKTQSNRTKEESDSDNTDSWNNNESVNPFLEPPQHKIQSQQQRLVANIFAESKPTTGATTTTITMVPLSGNESIPADSSALNPQLGEEAAETNIVTGLVKSSLALPSPSEFGGGNPFLMFLCLTLLLQHRTFVMKSAMDYNEMAMHFDKMVRKHDVTRVLNQARRMYGEYLKTQNALAAAKANESGNGGSTGCGINGRDGSGGGSGSGNGGFITGVKS